MARQESPPCRLLHTCKVALPEKGGIQIVANEVFKSLSETFVSTLISTRRSTAGAPPEIKNLNYSLKRPLFEIKSLPIAPNLVADLWRYSATHSATIVHYPFPLADIAIGLRPGRFNKVIVYWHSDIFEQKLLKKLLSPFTKRMLDKSTAIVVSSPKLIENSGFLNSYQSKCVVIPFGYNPDSNQQITDEGYYLCIGRHVKYKGIKYLIHAAAKTSARFVLIGDGPLVDDHVDLVKKLKLTEKVQFVQGASDAQVVEFISRCRALILPSISPNEAFGLVQIEAMAYGKPVINTDLPSAVPWVARDGIEAITVNPQDSDALAQAVERLQSDQSLRRRLSNNALERFQSTFAIELFHSKTKSLFKRILCE